MAQPPAPDAHAIVQASLEKNQRNDERLRDYTYVETTVTKRYDKSGLLNKTETKRFEVTNLYGSQYRHLVAKDGQTLTGKDKEKADAEYEREVAKRKNESDSDRHKREERQAKDRAESRKYMEEIPKAFDFQLVGEEHIEGHTAWVISAAPHPGYRSKVKNADMLAKFRGKLWIDKSTNEWVRVEAEAIQPVTWGGFIARIDPGAKLTIVETHLGEDLWVPVKLSVHVGGRVLFKRANLDFETIWSDYKRFRVESRLIAEEIAAPQN